jgi:hypothetical protein
MASSNQLVTATVHLAPQRLGFVNMDYFNPEPTAPNANTRNYTGTLADRMTVHGGVLDGTFSVTHFEAGVWGQGHEDLIITPTGSQTICDFLTSCRSTPDSRKTLRSIRNTRFGFR